MGWAVAVRVTGIALVLLVAGCRSSTIPVGIPSVADGQRVVWTDDFNGSRLDRQRWATCYWWEKDGCTIITNDELERYRAGQVQVRDGALQLEARPAPSRHEGRQFTHESGMVSSGRSGDSQGDRARFSFTYGHVQVRFRTPRGDGLWPAIWMLPTTNRSLPEIDLMEQYGNDTRSASMTLHTRGQDGTPARDRHEFAGPDLAEGWHTVDLDWSEGSLRWLLDGVERYRVDGPRVPSEPMYLVMNLAVGGQAGAVPDDTRFPARFLIDEVTVWTQT